MLLQETQTGSLIEVVDIQDLINPMQSSIQAQVQRGQEEQSPEPFAKQDLVFPSGEQLPRCWLDPDYRNSSAA